MNAAIEAAILAFAQSRKDALGGLPMTQSIETLAREIVDKARKTYVGGDAWPPLLEHAIRLALEAGEQRGIKLGREQAADIADGVERLQENDHGDANTGGAEQAAQAIRTLP